MFTIAYGEFQSQTYWGALFETLPIFLRWIAWPVALYLLCSVIAELIRYRSVPIAIFVFTFLFIAPALGAMGAYGPAHAAASVGIWAWPIFLLLIICKVIRRSRKHRRNGSPTAALQSA